MHETQRSAGASRDTLLMLLKRQGPLAPSDLAVRLGVTPTAVRQHLADLERGGLVVRQQLRHRLGRPARLWRLTPGAERVFPDGHAALCVALIAGLRSTLPRAELKRVVDAWGRASARRYAALLPRRAGLAARLRALASARNDEGFMVELRKVTGGTFELVQHHCPVGTAARAFPELCAAETRALCAALGEVRVLLHEHRLSGAERCVLRVARAR